MTTFEPTHGSIVHVELYGEDPASTRAFYADVFDWSFEDVEGMRMGMRMGVGVGMDYTMFTAPSPPHGGLVPKQEGDFQPPGTLVSLNVDDLAATRQAIADAGGELLVDEVEPPGTGAFAIFRAPGGVVQAAREDRSAGEPPEGGWDQPTDEPEPGSLVHVELYSEDPGSTRAFYADVFGWTFEDVGDGAYTMARPPTPPYGGLLAAGEHMPAGTLVYLLVGDAAAACEAIEAAGGEVVRAPFEVEGWGTMAVFEAPGGVVQAVWGSEDA